MMAAWQAILHDYVLMLCGWLLAVAVLYAFVMLPLEGLRWESFSLFRRRRGRSERPPEEI